jgi:hypothetical protein
MALVATADCADISAQADRTARSELAVFQIDAF